MSQEIYSIPASYRRMENMHIVFWLIKDISWCMHWRTMGLLMIIPTLTAAIIISYRTRNVKSELAHNLAVTFWIAANAYWMIAEFFAFDEVQVVGAMEGKHLALVPFLLGMGILIYYYLVTRPREKRAAQIATL